jgi:hypothetical protein
MAALLRTDPERGPLVAGGLVTLVVAALLIDARFENTWAAGGRLVVTGLVALLALALAIVAPQEGEVPPGWLSAILVAAFAITVVALGNLADALGADGTLSASGTLTWVGLLVTGMLVWFARTRNSAIMVLLAGVTATITLLAFADWAFGLVNPIRTFRWLLMLAALGLGALGISMRDLWPRQGVALIDAAGLAVLALALTFAVQAVVGSIAGAFGGGEAIATSGWGWELFVLAAGGALVAYAVWQRAPGPGYLGAVNLFAFVLMAQNSGGEPSLVGWPLWLLILALAVLALGLRPRPEPGPPPAAPPPPPSEAPTVGL